MSGRGRGRGRGRGGSQMSFDYSQLGFNAGDALPTPVLQPPPTFPPLEHKPVPLKTGPETEYMLALKRDFVEFLQSIRQNNDSSSMIERFSDKYQVASSDVKENWDSQIYWDALPAELNPKMKKSLKRKLEKVESGTSSKKPRIDITSKLNKLDELAKAEDKDEEEPEGGAEEAKESEEKEANEDNDKEILDDEEEEDEDEEMDDGTDYVNNYFDNGENYFEDEDDNLDDGPIY